MNSVKNKKKDGSSLLHKLSDTDPTNQPVIYPVTPI